MNLKELLGLGFPNRKALQNLRRENEKDFWHMDYRMTNLLGYVVDKEVLKEVGLRKIIDCYDTEEIIQILQHYHLLKGADNLPEARPAKKKIDTDKFNKSIRKWQGREENKR